MSIEVTRTSVQSMSYTREEVIERLVEGEDFDFRADDEPQNPAESRAAWGELSDTELAYHLALRLNDDGGGEEWLDNVVDDLYKGSDSEQWTCDGWTGNEPGSQLRDVITGEAIAARAAAGAGQLEPSAGALTSTNDEKEN